MTFYEGELFVADAGAHCLWVFDTEGSLLRVVGRPGSEPGRFRRPMGVAAANGRLYVTEHGGERLQASRRRGRQPPARALGGVWRRANSAPEKGWVPPVAEPTAS